MSERVQTEQRRINLKDEDKKEKSEAKVSQTNQFQSPKFFRDGKVKLFIPNWIQVALFYCCLGFLHDNQLTWGEKQEKQVNVKAINSSKS